MQRRQLSWATLGLLLSMSWVGADVLTLNNGDRLRGKVLREEGDTLVFKAALLPRPLVIPLSSVQSITETAVEAPAPPAKPASPAPGKVAKAPSVETVDESNLASSGDTALPSMEPEAEPKKSFELPENWDARFGLGYSDRQNERTSNREISAEGSLKWKGERLEAQWRGHYRYHSQEGKESASRYGLAQRLRHRGKEGFYVQSETQGEVDHVTKNRTQISQTAGVGYSPIKDEHLTLHVTPGFKAEHVAKAEREDAEGTAYKAHVQQDLKWKLNESVAIGQGLSYSVDPRRSENWDMDFQAFVETKVTDDVNLRVNYRRDFLNQSEGRPDKESAEVGASLVWDF